MNSETGKAVLNIPKPGTVLAPSVYVQPRSERFGFILDDRNPGGRKYISDVHLHHKKALSQTESEIIKSMNAPHAHINNVSGSRNKFGQDK